MKRTWRDKFEDTVEGAKECLAAISVFKSSDMLKVIPDPSVEGVWRITHYLGKKGSQIYGETNSKLITNSIVYMKGYADPFGRIRINNDFGTSDIFYKE